MQTEIEIHMKNKNIQSTNDFQKIFMKFSIVALNIIWIASIIFLIFLLLSDAKWGNRNQSNFSRVCFQKTNETVINGPIHRPAPAGLG